MKFAYDLDILIMLTGEDNDRGRKCHKTKSAIHPLFSLFVFISDTDNMSSPKDIDIKRVVKVHVVDGFV